MAQDKPDMDILRLAAERAADEPSFFAYVLREYRAMFSLDQRSLARKLGCTVDDMTRLALCRKPDLSAPKWSEDLEKVANYVRVDAVLLLNILREVDSLAVMKTVPSASNAFPEPQPGLLAAARLRRPGARRKPRSKPDKGK